MPSRAKESSLTTSSAERLRAAIDRYFELCLFGMLVTGFIAVAGTDRLDLFAMALVLVALLVRGYQLYSGKRTVLSERITSRLTIAYVAFYVIDFFAISASFLTATVHMVLFIMVVKLFSIQRDRDHVYLAVISFMMLLSAATLTVDSFFLGAFCVYLLLTVATFISMEMRRSLRGAEPPAKSAHDDAESTEPAPLKVTLPSTVSANFGSRLSTSLSRAAFILVATIVIGAAGIFFILPRVSANYLSSFSQRNNFVAGFSDDVKLGEIGRIQQTDAVVMHIQFTDRSKVPADLKWRGVSLAYFDGTRWFNDRRGAMTQRGIGGQFDLRTPEIWSRIAGGSLSNERSVLEYRVSMQPLGIGNVFLAPVPLSMNANIREIAVEATGGVYANDVTRQLRSYVAASLVSPPEAFQRANASADFPEPIRQKYLQLPALNPRIAQYTAEITAKAKNPYEKAAAIEQHLVRQFGYTLEMEVSPDPKVDPLSYFLFTRKKGHCEYFASAMAIMLRTQGIPSRIVNGFRNGEFNDVSGSYTVRAKDAHAWVEAFIPGYGWATFDPTPAADVTPMTPWRRISLYMDAAREFWNEWVVNYDFSHQNQLGQSSISKGREIFDKGRIWMREQYDALLARAKTTRKIVSESPERFGARGVALIALVILLINVRKIARYISTVRVAGKPKKAPRAAATIWYERLTRALGRRGFERAPVHTPQEYVASINDESVRASLLRFTEHYEKARFGDSAEDAAKLPELYDEVVESLKD